MRLRLLICGDRYWDDPDFLFTTLSAIGPGNIELVIEGGQRGVDIQARDEAWRLMIPVLEIKARWNELQRTAGQIRNGEMLQFGKPTHILAVHDDIETSKGTKNMLEQGRQAQVPFKLISHQRPHIPATFWEQKGLLR